MLVIVDLTSPAAEWQGLGDGYRLDAGTPVIAHPDDTVREGIRVQPRTWI